MSDAETASDPPADPLGRRRCPKCLYDRFGLAEGQACPECGYVVPAGVVVLTLRRVLESRRVLKIHFFSLLVFAFLAIRVRGGVWGFFSAIAFILPSIATIIVRAFRMAWSSDAYVCQLWINRAGIGLERDADRFSILRMASRVASPVLAYGALAAMFAWQLVALGVVEFVFIPMSILTGGGAAVWFTRWRAALPALDAISPQMLRWERLRLLGISSQDDVTTITLRLDGFWTWPFNIQCAGGVAVAEAIRELIAQTRQSVRSSAVVEGAAL